MTGKCAAVRILALRYDGTPIRRVKASYADGAYSFRLSIDPVEEAVAYYALVPKGSLAAEASAPPPIAGPAVARL